MRLKRLESKLLEAGIFCAVALGIGPTLGLAAATFTDANWTAVGSGMGGVSTPSVGALTVSGSDVYAGGFFRTAGGTPANYIAKWDGSSWSPLGSGLGGLNGVHALAMLGSNLYAGGEFSTAGGMPAYYAAKWNGSSWTNLGSGAPGTVWALAASGSELYAGGSFGISANGSNIDCVAKWDGSSWTLLGSGMGPVASPYGVVSGLAVSGNDLYAGGHFWTAGGTSATNIAKWNGTSWSAVGSGVNGHAYALAVSGSDLYVGGSFTTAGGIPANSIAKWNGSSWTSLNSTAGSPLSVYALAVSGSNLYAGGVFTTADGSVGKNIAKWDGTNWSALGSGTSGGVFALAVSGNDLYVGGYFRTAGATPSTNIARAYLPPLPTLSILGSGSSVSVSWPSDSDGFGLELTEGLTAPASWISNGASVSDDGTNRSVTIPGTNGAHFFRLRRP